MLWVVQMRGPAGSRSWCRPDQWHGLDNYQLHFCQYRSGEGESKSWRETVIYLIGEWVWEKLLRRQGGEPYGTLSLFVREGLEITVQQFVEGVARYAGPDAVDLLKPHLPEITRDGLAPDPQEEEMGIQGNGNHYPVAVAELGKQELAVDRRIASAPELAVRLYTQKLLTKEHLEAIGRLAKEGRHNDAAQETLPPSKPQTPTALPRPVRYTPVAQSLA
jgi:hypothetical protein